MTKDTIESEEELTIMEEFEEQLVEALELDTYFCCDGRECGCSGVKRSEVMKDFLIKALTSTQEERDRSWRERIEGKIASARKDAMNVRDMDGKKYRGKDGKIDGAYYYGNFSGRVEVLTEILSDTKTNEK